MNLTNEYVLTIKSGSLSRKIRRDFPDEYKKIINIDTFSTFKEQLYLYLNPEKQYKCKKCSEKTKIFRYSQGFTDYCSPKCRGRIPPSKIKSIPKITELTVSYWPLPSTLIEIAKAPNYSKSQIKREFFDFYCYVEGKYEFKNFNEKLYAYLNNGRNEVCNVCENTTAFDPGNFRYKKFCSKRCANEYNKKYLTGGYNLKYFEQYPKEKDKPAYFYFIEVSNKTEKFLKIGITCRDLKYRKSEICGSNYAAKILSIKQMTLYECHKLESKLKENEELSKHVPLIGISGKTECFNINEKEKIWKLI